MFLRFSNPHRVGSDAYWAWIADRVAAAETERRADWDQAIMRLWHHPTRYMWAEMPYKRLTLGAAATFLRADWWHGLSQNAARARLDNMHGHVNSAKLMLIVERAGGGVRVQVEDMNGII